jgi:heparanase
MTATEHLAAALQSFSIERFRLVVAALEMEEAGQVIEAPQYIRVTRPEHLAARLKRSHETLKAARRRRAPSPGAPIWITETADAACGGNRWGSTFLDTFRYVDQMGRLAKRGVQAIFHNTLASSEYGLLDQSDFHPRPNYWAALLWRRLMGTVVLGTGASREGLHLYAQCLRGHPGGVALLAINNSRTESSDITLTTASVRYTLSAPTLQSTSVMLNGRPLKLDPNDNLPEINGRAAAAGSIHFAPATITYLAIPEAANAACAAARG